MNGTEIQYIQQAFSSNWVAPLGQNVDMFEDAVKTYLDMPFALGVNTGTAAIHLALKYTGVGAGDIVFCSDITFAASCNPILYLQAQPVFIDSDPDSWCMSPALLFRALKEHKRLGRLPKAVIVVDLYGLPADYDQILNICSDFGVPVIEDAAEALGASYKNGMCGSFGDVGILSFNANKIITTSSGGMVLAKQAKAIEKMKYWATQARENTPYYEHKEVGYNYRLSNICAGIGCGQMSSLNQYVQARRRICQTYAQGLSDLPVSFNPVIEGAEPSFWLSVLVLHDNCGVTVSEIAEAVGRENIETRPFWKPMHTQPVFQGHPFYHRENAPPVGEHLFEKALCLPSGSAMSEDVQYRTIDLIRECFKRNHAARCQAAAAMEVCR
jgi:pyridoxal phosphate-dependent aminotransferase EpsN